MTTSIEKPTAVLQSVLLVDDNQMDNAYHRIVIEKTGLTESILVALHGEEALEVLRRTVGTGEEPEIILLDINMPVMDGFEFLEAFAELKEELPLRSIVVIMLTTSLLVTDKEKAAEFPHLKGYMTKPLSGEAFRAIVDQYFLTKEVE